MKINDMARLKKRDFEKYLKELRKECKKAYPTKCCKCEDIIIPSETVSVSFERNITDSNFKIKKSCSLCEACYVDLLEFLGINDLG